MRASSEAGLILGFKAGAALSQFVLLVLTARWFGVEFRGELAIFAATVQLLVLVVGFFAGSSLVYLAAREPTRSYLTRLLAASYAACVALPIALALGATALEIPLGREPALLVLTSILYGLLTVNACVLLAGQEAWRAALVEFLRPFVLVAVAVAVATTRGYREPREFYALWAASSVLSFLLTLPFLVAHTRRLAPMGPGQGTSWMGILRQLTGYGLMAQTGNLVQYLNYRALYFAIERHSGLAAVGLFSTAVSMAEALWLPTGSLAALTLNRVSRVAGSPETRWFVLRLTRVALVAMAVAAAAMLWLPAAAITEMFGRDFTGVRVLLVWLLPGIVALGVSQVAAAYHAGHGRYERNLVAALAGLAVTLAGFVWLVPGLGTSGALVTMNASYIVTGGWVLAVFFRSEHVSPNELRPRIADFAIRPGSET